MNAQENIRIVQDTFRLFGIGDLNGMLRYYTENSEFIFPGPPDLVPLSGTYRGIEQIRKFFALADEHLQFEVFEQRQFLAQDDQVVTLSYVKGTIRSTGKPFEQEWVHISTIRDGKILRWQDFNDTYQLATSFIPVSAQQAKPMQV